MDIEDQFELEHLFLKERKCRVCSEQKNLIDGFYLTRKNRKATASSYSYECKVCTIRRIVDRRKNSAFGDWKYPDW